MSPTQNPTPSPRETLFNHVQMQLVRRVMADRTYTAKAAEWAHDELLAKPGAGLDASGALSAVVLKSQMLHLARQHDVLQAAWVEQVSRTRGDRRREDALQQAFVELLRGLAEHPQWTCGTDGKPCLESAKANLQRRARCREINAWTRTRGEVGVDPNVLGTLAHVEDSVLAAELDREFRRHLEARIPAGDLPKLERYFQWLQLGLTDDEIAALHGMRSDALRQERSRLSAKLRPIVTAYRGDVAA
jgi:DNA-directed RNA polymerase specialized sigma24 family protein